MPVATAPPRMVSRLQPCVATDSEDLLRPRLGEGRNNVLRRSCAHVRCLRPCMIGSALPLKIEEENGSDQVSIRISSCHRVIRHRMVRERPLGIAICFDPCFHHNNSEASPGNHQAGRIVA